MKFKYDRFGTRARRVAADHKKNAELDAAQNHNISYFKNGMIDDEFMVFKFVRLIDSSFSYRNKGRKGKLNTIVAMVYNRTMTKQIMSCNAGNCVALLYQQINIKEAGSNSDGDGPSQTSRKRGMIR